MIKTPPPPGAKSIADESLLFCSLPGQDGPKQAKTGTRQAQDRPRHEALMLDSGFNAGFWL